MRETPAGRARAALPVIDRPPTTPRRATARATDRQVTFAGLLVAAGFLGAALLGLAHLVVGRTGLWVPLHLALAGGAGTAIAAVLPFFSAALAAAPAADPRLRIAAIGGVAGGAAIVSVAAPLGWTLPAMIGGSAYVAGMIGVAVAATRPLRTALGVRRRLVERAYVLAVASVSTGVVMAVAMLAGAPAVLERWAMLKPAHAWLNVFGFVALVVAATLVHFAPTVAGGRIVPRRSASVAIFGLAAGPPLVALGFVLAADVVVRAGAIAAIVGAAALALHGLLVHRARGRWTTDAGWHRFTSWSVAAAPVWLLAATAVAGGRLVWLGADPAAWSIGLVAAPLGLGFAVQILVGAWTHLIPAIGPGDPATHAGQRQRLGRGATLRVLALQAGTAAAWSATLTGVMPLGALGLALVVLSIGAALALLVGAAAPFRRPVPVTAS